MTREEEIEQGSIDFMGPVNAYNPLPWFSFREGAKWADKTIIEKACEWLKRFADGYTWYNEIEGKSGITDNFITEFKKAMEE